MSKDKFKNQRKPTQKEIDAMDNYDKPLKPQPELPSGGMGGKKGGVVKMHKMPGGKMMKNSDMKKKKKMGGGMMSDESFQYSKGGMVRGQGIAIKGTKFKGIF